MMDFNGAKLRSFAVTVKFRVGNVGFFVIFREKYAFTSQFCNKAMPDAVRQRRNLQALSFIRNFVRVLGKGVVNIVE